MNINVKAVNNLYLINLLKFRSKKPILYLNLEKQISNKDKFIINKLTYLSNNSLYSKELERLSKENKEKILKLNKKIEMKKINYKENNKKMNNIFKGSCNKMILDLIYNNPKIKKYFLSYDKNKDNKYKLNSKNFLPLFNFEQCHTDNINLLSVKNKNKHLRKSISALYKNNHTNPKYKIQKPQYLSLDEKNINSNNFINSHRKSKSKSIDDSIKGMLTINYNNNFNKLINMKRHYSSYINSLK